MDMPALQRLAPSGVTALIAFLSFSSQWLFYFIEPGPLPKTDVYRFNALVICLLICYWRTCLTDPGKIPKDWHKRDSDKAAPGHGDQGVANQTPSNRWCRRCETFKPPRAHHCKTCKRCVIKMDHHCVWTANCVSHITIPHFIRFLAYAVAATVFLESFIAIRGAVLWKKRHLPSYLGPSIFQLVHLFILFAINSLVCFALVLLLGRTLWSLAVNTWTIESWEIERHHALVRRARVLGGFLDGPDGNKVPIERQEFPWDIGIWNNICQGMGSKNPLVWLWPMAASPRVETGLSFPHNEIEDPRKPWPPPDPDRLFRATRTTTAGNGFTQSLDVNDFRRRQAADLALYADADGDYVIRRRPFHEYLEQMSQQNDTSYADAEDDRFTDEDDSGDDSGKDGRGRPRFRDNEGEEAWRNKEGERLADFGVDEVADFYDEDDIPLAELMRRRKAERSREE